MNLVLEMKAGPSPRKKLLVAEGQKFVIGRSAPANFSFPEDSFLSGSHCAVSASPVLSVKSYASAPRFDLHPLATASEPESAP